MWECLRPRPLAGAAAAVKFARAEEEGAADGRAREGERERAGRNGMERLIRQRRDGCTETRSRGAQELGKHYVLHAERPPPACDTLCTAISKILGVRVLFRCYARSQYDARDVKWSSSPDMHVTLHLSHMCSLFASFPRYPLEMCSRGKFW